MRALLSIALSIVTMIGACFADQPGNSAQNSIQQVRPVGDDGETSEAVLCVASYFEVRDRYPEDAPGYAHYMDESSFWLRRLKKLIPDPAGVQSRVFGTRPFIEAVKRASPTAIDAFIRDCERAKKSLPDG